MFDLQVTEGHAAPATPYFNRTLGPSSSLLRARVDFALSNPPLPRPRAEAARRGLRYERKVLEALTHRYGLRSSPQLPLFFQTCSKRGRAVLDALVLFPGRRALVVEVKLSFSVDAFYQLHKFYLPIVREALPGFSARGLIICQNFDPWVKTPMATALVLSPDEAFDVAEGLLPVMTTRDGRW